MSGWEKVFAGERLEGVPGTLRRHNNQAEMIGDLAAALNRTGETPVSMMLGVVVEEGPREQKDFIGPRYWVRQAITKFTEQVFDIPGTPMNPDDDTLGGFLSMQFPDPQYVVSADDKVYAKGSGDYVEAWNLAEVDTHGVPVGQHVVLFAVEGIDRRRRLVFYYSAPGRVSIVKPLAIDETYNDLLLFPNPADFTKGVLAITTPGALLPIFDQSQTPFCMVLHAGNVQLLIEQLPGGPQFRDDVTILFAHPLYGLNTGDPALHIDPDLPQGMDPIYLDFSSTFLKGAI